MNFNYTLRFSGSMLGAAVLTLGLFYLMVILITQNFVLPNAQKGSTVSWVKPVEMQPGDSH